MVGHFLRLVVGLRELFRLRWRDRSRGRAEEEEFPRAGEEGALLVKSEYGLWQDEVMMTRGAKDTNTPLTGRPRPCW